MVTQQPQFKLPRFNSRSRMGSDRGWRCCLCGLKRFNSRSRMGSDWQTDRLLIPVAGFNSRSRMGSDERLHPL